MIVVAWIILSIIVGAIGKSKKIGFAGGFFLSLIFSPVIGILIVIASPVKEDKPAHSSNKPNMPGPDVIPYKKPEPVKQTPKPEPVPEKPKSNVADLEKLADLKDKGIITQEEFDAKKKQILGL